MFKIYFEGSKNDFKGISSIFPAPQEFCKTYDYRGTPEQIFLRVLKMILKAFPAFSRPSGIL